MVPLTAAREIRSSSGVWLATARASRRVPGPLSAVEVTVICFSAPTRGAPCQGTEVSTDPKVVSSRQSPPWSGLPLGVVEAARSAPVRR